MKYLHKEVKATRHSSVVVTFDQPARILLLKEPEYKKYKAGRSFSYRGGNAAESPVKFVLPDSATWHIIIERGSYFNPKNINASVQVFPPGIEAEGKTLDAPSNGIIKKLEEILNSEG